MGAHFQAPPPVAVSRVLASFTRDQLAGFIEVAIDLLDMAEPDPDLEPNGDELDGDGAAEDEFVPFPRGDRLPGDPDDEEDDDPAGGNVEDEGEAVNEDGVERVFAESLRYGLDQTRGPINIAEATREDQARELGLVRSPTGGWRFPESAR